MRMFFRMKFIVCLYDFHTKRMDCTYSWHFIFIHITGDTFPQFIRSFLRIRNAKYLFGWNALSKFYYSADYRCRFPTSGASTHKKFPLFMCNHSLLGRIKIRHLPFFVDGFFGLPFRKLLCFAGIPCLAVFASSGFGSI